MRNRLQTGLVLLLVLLTGCASGKDATAVGGSFTFVSPGGKTEFSYPVGDRRPIGDLGGPDLSGSKTLKASDYRGRVVVLNFWGSWCPPCRLEAPGLQAASQALASQGVQFLGVNVRDDKGAGADFNATKGITYPSIYDPRLQTLLSLRGYPTTAIPSTIVLDRSGRVAHIWLTVVTKDELLDVIKPIAAES